MTSIVQDYRRWLEKQKVKKGDLERRIDDNEAIVKRIKEDAARFIKARWVVSEVSRLTQNRFKTRVEELVTRAIRSVMDQRLRGLVEFEIKGRGKADCYLRLLDEHDNPYMPKYEQGGLMINLIGFALNIVLLCLQRPRSRKLLVLDERFPFSGKGEPLRRVGQMLKEISHSLGFQMIIVTHEPELAEIADRAWEVDHDGVRSSVKLMDGERNISWDGNQAGMGESDVRQTENRLSLPKKGKREALEL